ncbi:MAG: class I SAM-dependent methyltransferase [Ferruginibacter sp.]
MKIDHKGKIIYPDIKLLSTTGAVDYYQWNYKFPIKYIQRYRFKRIVKLLGKQQFSNLLEIGTGSGVFIPELSRHTLQMHACDIHTKFGHFPELFKIYGVSNCSYSSQSIEETNFPDEHFDAIVAVSVLEFVPDLSKALKEIKRLLKPSGVFITICPMESRILDFFLSFYTRKKPRDEFGGARKKISKQLEEEFMVAEKGYMLPIIGSIFPVYTHYKLLKP